MTIVDVYTWLNSDDNHVNMLCKLLKTSEINKIAAALQNTGKNNIRDAIAAILSVKDLRHLIWSANPTGTSGTHGTYLKAVNNNRFYKLSAGDSLSGIYGHESINECIISDILDVLGIEHVKYSGAISQIILNCKEQEEFVCWSDNYRADTDSKIALDTCYELYSKPAEEPISFFKRMGFWDDLQLYIIADFLIINRDRHGANIEVVKHCNGTLEVAPMFDHGLSLVAPQQNNTATISAFSPMTDVTVNNFVGSNSLYTNLQLIETPQQCKPISISAVTTVVNKYTPYLSDAHVNKIIDIIWSRYQYLEKEGLICH